MTLAPVRRPTCEARLAAWKASPSTYTPPWKYKTTWRGSIPAMVISATGDAAQRGRGHGQIGGQRLPRYQLLEQSPLLADVAVGGEGILTQDRVEGLPLLGAHDGSPSVGVG